MCRRKSGEAVFIDETHVRVYVLGGEDSHTEICSAHKLRDDAGPLARRMTPVELVAVGDLCDSGQWEFVFDAGRPEWWTEAHTAEAIRQLREAAGADWDGDELKYTGDLDLGGLTSLPANAKLTAGGSLDLRGLTSLPAGVKAPRVYLAGAKLLHDVTPTTRKRNAIKGGK